MNKIIECLQLCFDFKNPNRLEEHDKIFHLMTSKEKELYKSIKIKTSQYNFLETFEEILERYNLK